MRIERATKRKQKLRLALTGVTGSGKTYSSLLLAFSMVKKVCVIDTERGSASLYSDDFPEYDTIQLTPPYSPQRYIEAIHLAEAQGYECIIIDSLSHNWAGQGGCLEMVENAANSSHAKNTYTAWAKVTPQHQALLDCINASPAHIIATMRSKTHYDLSQNSKGKMVPVKIGLAPVQRDGVDYEFTFLFDIDQQHNFFVSKQRVGVTNRHLIPFVDSDVPVPLDKTIGVMIMSWLNDGAEPTKEEVEEEVTKKARSLYSELQTGVVSKESATTRWRALLTGYPESAISSEMKGHFTSMIDSLHSKDGELPDVDQ